MNLKIYNFMRVSTLVICGGDMVNKNIAFRECCILRTTTIRYRGIQTLDIGIKLIFIEGKKHSKIFSSMNQWNSVEKSLMSLFKKFQISTHSTPVHPEINFSTVFGLE